MTNVSIHVSGHPKLGTVQIPRYGELPDAKLVGRYSTPLLFNLWCEWIKQTLKTTMTEVDVLLPIAFGKKDLNKGKKMAETGFRSNGTVSKDLHNTLDRLSVMVPKEWMFSYFERRVSRNQINCDDLEVFKAHMAKPMEFVAQCLGKTPATKSATTTPASKRSKSSTSEMNSFAMSIRKTFVFGNNDDDEDTKEEEALVIAADTLSEAFKEYYKAGVIKKVFFDAKKLLEFHEDDETAPENCGKGIMSLWNEYKKKVNEKKEALASVKKQLANSKSKGKRKSEESTESLRSSPRVVSKRRKFRKSFGDD